MPRRKATAILNPSPHVPPMLDWEIATRLTVNGRQVEVGTELKIKGEPGRFLFVKQVTRPNGIEWIDVVHVDSKGASTGYRSFRTAQIQTVHRVTKTRANAA